MREVDYGTAVQGFHGEGIRGCLLVDGYDRVECCWKWKDRIVFFSWINGIVQVEANLFVLSGIFLEME